MQITSKTVMIELQDSISFGPENQVKGTVICQAFVSRNDKGEIDVEIDEIDLEDITFLGGEVKNFKEFKESMFRLGFDIQESFDNACVGLVISDDIETLKEMCKDIL